MSETAEPGLGHNQPPLTLFEMLEPERVLQALEKDFATEKQRTDNLIAGYERLKERLKLAGEKDSQLKLAGGVADEDDQAKITSFVLQIKRHSKALDTKRDQLKRPFDAAARVYQAFFKGGQQDKLDAAAKAIEDGPLKAYANKKIADERRARQEEADRRQKEADEAAAAAARTGNDGIYETAIEQQQIADNAHKAAAAPVADLGRGRGTFGGVAAAQNKWEFEVTDPALVPREYLIVDHSLIRAAVKRKDSPARDIPGVRIYEDLKVSVR